jgi:hypothetical protein
LKNEIFSQLLSVFCWRYTTAVNFSLYLLDKSILQSIRKGIFNIKLGYYTCKRKDVIITYIIWAYCCGFEGSLLPWFYLSMIYIAVQSDLITALKLWLPTSAHVGGLYRVHPFLPSLNKTDRHDITEIFVKVAFLP